MIYVNSAPARYVHTLLHVNSAPARSIHTLLHVNSAPQGQFTHCFTSNEHQQGLCTHCFKSLLQTTSVYRHFKPFLLCVPDTREYIKYSLNHNTNQGLSVVRLSCQHGVEVVLGVSIAGQTLISDCTPQCCYATIELHNYISNTQQTLLQHF